MTGLWRVILVLGANGYSLQTASAGELQLDLGVESRIFRTAPLDPRQHGSHFSATLLAEWYKDTNDGDDRVVISPYLRLDEGDAERTHADLRQLYWRHTAGAVDVYLGVRRVFWGVTEALHLVDVINQTDLVENLDGEDRLGQPMLQLGWQQHWGQVELFVLPWFRERTFPGTEGRLRAPLPVLTDSARYEAGNERRHLDWAVRYFTVLGPVEFGIAHFSGTQREPTLMPSLDPTTLQPVLVPLYELTDQSSFDLAAVVGDWLWKLEALSRRDNTGRSTAFTGGIEYTLVGLGVSRTDLGLVAEYQFDDRGANASFQNDIVLGARFAFNDVQSSELLVLTGLDLDRRSRLYSIEGSRRLGNSWRVSIEARLFDSDDPRDALFSLRRDDYLQLSLEKFY
jgi:hypothetical protein